MATSKIEQYYFYIYLKNKPTSEIKVVDSFTLGSGPRNDYILPAKNFHSKLFEIKKQTDHYILHFSGENSTAKINNVFLEKNKNYLLAENDSITSSDLKIDFKKKQILDFKSNSYFTGVPVFKEINDATNKIAVENKDKKNCGIKKEKLFPLKIYSIIIDLHLTYFFLICVLPNISLTAHEILFSLVNSQYIGELNSHLKFLIIWYVLNFSQNLVLGTTAGQLLVGLKNKKEISFLKIIGRKTKSFMISLLLIPGQNSTSTHILFKIMRFALLPIALILLLAFPWFQYKNQSPQVYLEFSTLIFKNSSDTLLNSYILPIWSENELAEIKIVGPNQVNQQISSEKFKIINFMSYNDIENNLKYANPLYSLLNKKLIQRLPKNKIHELVLPILASRSNDWKNILVQLGPYFGNITQLKKIFYTHSQRVIKIKSYDDFFLMTTQDKKAYILYFAKYHLFLMNVPEDFIQKLAKNRQFASSIDLSFLNSLSTCTTLLKDRVNCLPNYTSLLTYYSNKVKNLLLLSTENKNHVLVKEYKMALIESINSLRQYLNNDTTRSDFNLLFDQLTPL